MDVWILEPPRWTPGTSYGSSREHLNPWHKRQLHSKWVTVDELRGYLAWMKKALPKGAARGRASAAVWSPFPHASFLTAPTR